MSDKSNPLALPEARDPAQPAQALVASSEDHWSVLDRRLLLAGVTILVIIVLRIASGLINGVNSYLSEQPMRYEHCGGLTHQRYIDPRYRYLVVAQSDCTGLGYPFYWLFDAPTDNTVTLLSKLFGPPPHAYRGPLPMSAELAGLLEGASACPAAPALPPVSGAAEASVPKYQSMPRDTLADFVQDYSPSYMGSIKRKHSYLELKPGGVLIVAKMKDGTTEAVLVDIVHRQDLKRYLLTKAGWVTDPFQSSPADYEAERERREQAAELEDDAAEPPGTGETAKLKL